MDNFIQEELYAGCFNGPFTKQQANIIFDGHFHTAPLGFVENPGSTSLRLICHHSKEDGFGQLTNGWLDPSMDATRFYTAANAAEFMSLMSRHLFQPSSTLYNPKFARYYHGKLLHCPIYT